MSTLCHSERNQYWYQKTSQWTSADIRYQIQVSNMKRFMFNVLHFSPLESSLQYLISINVSEPMSIALNIKERKRVEKKSRVQTFPLSALSSLWVFGIPWIALDCSKIIAASAEDFSCFLKHLIRFNWSASWVNSLIQKIKCWWTLN